MLSRIKELTFSLCNVPGTPGCESDAMNVAVNALSYCEEVEQDTICGVHGFFGDKNSKDQIMLDAHIDQIGMVITEIDEDGFLHLTNVGGIDRHTMPGSRVTVYGKTPMTGIVCVLPPHISGQNDKISSVDDQAVDIGMTKDEAEEVVSIGDRVILTNPVKEILGNRVAGTALDDRAGCACIIRAGELLQGKKLNCGVHIVCSTKEEVGGQGAAIYSNRIKPTHAVAVDVSFAKQSGVDKAGLAELSKGPMIGFAAILDREICKKFIEVAKKNEIPYQLEAMGGRTGTNCDAIVKSGQGVKCTLISIPERNMHTPSEICDLEDMENIAKLIASYIENVYGEVE